MKMPVSSVPVYHVHLAIALLAATFMLVVGIALGQTWGRHSPAVNIGKSPACGLSVIFQSQGIAPLANPPVPEDRQTSI